MNKKVVAHAWLQWKPYSVIKRNAFSECSNEMHEPKAYFMELRKSERKINIGHTNACIRNLENGRELFICDSIGETDRYQIHGHSRVRRQVEMWIG